MKKGEWNEVSLDAFLEIFDMYRNHMFPEKILELAGLAEFKCEGKPGSLFFGESIDFFKDFKKYSSERMIQSLERLDENTLKQDTQITFCAVSGTTIKEDGPLIAPILSQGHLDLVYWSWLGGELTESVMGQIDGTSLSGKDLKPPYQFWYYKKNDKKSKYVSPLDGKLKEFEKDGDTRKYVMVRVIDHEFFTSLVEEYIATNGNLSNEFYEDYPSRRSLCKID